MEINVIAYIQSPFKEKFGIPRQSGLSDVISTIIFEKAYRDPNALRGLEGFSHLWLIWGFSENGETTFRPMVRPPRLGGSTRMGVFATRSPFRPNPLGLSSVRLKGIRTTENGTVIDVIGADLLDGTPIYDIKPYLGQFDCHADSRDGFVDSNGYDVLTVDFPQAFLEKIPESERMPLLQALSQDPRPQYQEDHERVYGMRYDSFNVKFTVGGGVLKVQDIEQVEN